MGKKDDAIKKKENIKVMWIVPDYNIDKNILLTKKYF